MTLFGRKLRNARFVARTFQRLERMRREGRQPNARFWKDHRRAVRLSRRWLDRSGDLDRYTLTKGESPAEAIDAALRMLMDARHTTEMDRYDTPEGTVSWPALREVEDRLMAARQTLSIQENEDA